MKKILAIVLATLLAATLTVGVCAASTTNDSHDVYVKLSDTEAPNYDILLDWGNFDFVYNVEKTWDASNHSYTRTGTFTHTNADIEITNNSNVRVDVVVELEDADGSDILGIDFDDSTASTFIMNKATEGAAETETVTVELTGVAAFEAAIEAEDLTEARYAELKDEYDDFKVGTISISFTAKNVGE